MNGNKTEILKEANFSRTQLLSSCFEKALYLGLRLFPLFRNKWLLYNIVIDCIHFQLLLDYLSELGGCEHSITF